MKNDKSGYDTLVKIWNDLTAKATKISVEIAQAKNDRKTFSEAEIKRIVSQADASLQSYKDGFISFLDTERKAILNPIVDALKNDTVSVNQDNFALDQNNSTVSPELNKNIFDKVDKINKQIGELKSILESGKSTKEGRGEKFWAEFITSNQGRVAAITKDVVSLAQEFMVEKGYFDFHYLFSVEDRMTAVKDALKKLNKMSKNPNNAKRYAAIQGNIDWFSRNIIANLSYALLGLKVAGVVAVAILAGIGKMAQIIAAFAVAVVVAALKFALELARSPAILFLAGTSKMVNPKKTDVTAAWNQVGAMWAKYVNNLHDTYKSFINLAQSVSWKQNKKFGKEFGETLGKLIMGAKPKEVVASPTSGVLENENTAGSEVVDHEVISEKVASPEISSISSTNMFSKGKGNPLSRSGGGREKAIKSATTPQENELLDQGLQNQSNDGVAPYSKHPSPPGKSRHRRR